MEMVAKKQKKATQQEYKCGYCGKVYKRESSLVKHMCKQKQRVLLRDTKEAKVALDIWLRFRKFARLPYKKNLQPYEAFAQSGEFQGFVDFGKYLIETQIIEHDKFIDKLLMDSVPIKQWTSHAVRKAWIKSVIFREHPDTAIARSIHAIQEWADNTGNEWQDFFKDVSTQRALLWIETGKISPWFIHAASTREELIGRFNDDEIQHIFEFLDPGVWGPKKVKYKVDYDAICGVFEANGI